MLLCRSTMTGQRKIATERRREYPDGWVERLFCNKPLWGGTIHNEPEKLLDAARGGGGEEPENPENIPKMENIQRACRRASRRVRELSHCADFKYFVTLTLDAQKVDRYDPEQIIRKMNYWCDNQVRRKGLVYVLVPERHKDGAIHFHGFFNDALPVVDSGTISMKGRKRPIKPRSKAQRVQMLADGGRVVYNLPAWSLGFTTAIELYGEYNAAVSYTCKYLTKQVVDGGQKIAGRWYYHGGDFKPYKESAGYMDYTAARAYLDNVAWAHDGWKVQDFAIPDTDLMFMKLAYWKNGKREWEGQDESGTIYRPL